LGRRTRRRSPALRRPCSPPCPAARARRTRRTSPSPDTQTGPRLISTISAVHKPNCPIGQGLGSLTIQSWPPSVFPLLSNSGPNATAAVRVTGRSWCLYTTSVVRVLEWPTASAICSMGTPESDRSAPYRSVDGHRASLKVHLGPAQGAGFLGADAAEHTHGDVEPQAFSLSCVQHGNSLLQVERPRRPSRISCGDGGQIRDIPDHQVVHHRVPDGLDQDHPGQPNAPG